ncbi:MAG: hypothetical protein ABIT04_04150 [Novosphingobium sp.]
MNSAILLLAPLLLTMAGPVADGGTGGDKAAASYAAGVAHRPTGAMTAILPSTQEASRAERANQVRIEEHITIRIVPRGSRPDPTMQLPMPNRVGGLRFTQRSIGRCLAVAGIAGVQPSLGGELILYMRDRRVVSGMLERACRARDFYSGFYLARSNDGKLCVDRDMLLSRNGANCKLTQIRELILDD